jgi:tetratricopeptide (TPR) repeat protein
MRDTVRETTAAFGDADKETAMALMNLAITARNHGHLQEASAAMQRASTISARLVLRAADRHEILRSDAIIKMALGQHQAAGRQIEQLLSITSQPAERARLLNLPGQVDLKALCTEKTLDPCGQ